MTGHALNPNSSYRKPGLAQQALYNYTISWLASRLTGWLLCEATPSGMLSSGRRGPGARLAWWPLRER